MEAVEGAEVEPDIEHEDEEEPQHALPLQAAKSPDIRASNIDQAIVLVTQSCKL